MKTKYTVNKDYFKVIDSHEKAYILGFLYADGYNHEKRGRVVLNLQECDKEILLKIKNCLEYTGPLLYDKKKLPRVNQFRLAINNKTLSEDLAKLGCMQAKTFKIKFPDFINNEFLSSFILGYFDGDGSIFRVVNKNYFYYGLSIIGTEDLIKGILNYLNNNLKLNCKLDSAYRTKNKKGNDTIKELRIGGKYNIIQILEHLYKNSPLFLQRKKEKYLHFKNDKTNINIGNHKKHS
jgi:hypothetical protein